jgi:2-polyprenyl-6-methoxyphenol hydroxylase-like FAD-dependent oxidoreductase
MTPKASTLVLIIGGGLGGLALAQRLRTAGISATVFERDGGPSARTQGYRISINDDGLAALRALLPTPRFAALATLEAREVGRDFHFATGGLAPLLRFRAGSGVGALTVSRGRLRALLGEGLDVRWNQRLSDFSEDDGGVTAHFADGSRARGQLLIGCDGAGSDVRERMRARGGRGLPELVPTGLVSVGAVIPRSAEWERALPLNRDGAVQHLGPDGTAMFVSFCERDDGAGALLWVLSRRDPDAARDDRGYQRLGATPAGRAQLLADCLARVERSGWHPALRQLVRATPADAVIDPIALKATKMPKPQRQPMWPTGRVTLLGDAAHAMPPQRGIGGNTAFVDAQVLAERLIDAEAAPAMIDWRALSRDYERDLMKRGRRAVEESNETADLCHLTGTLPVALRNTILRAVDRLAAAKAALAGAFRTANSAENTLDLRRQP